jgi:hypothetical protein
VHLIKKPVELLILVIKQSLILRDADLSEAVD